MLTKIVLVTLLTTIVSSEYMRYDNYTLYKVEPKTEEHVAYLKDLHTKEDSVVFWQVPYQVGGFASVVASPEGRTSFEYNLKKRNINAEVILDDIQKVLDSDNYSRKKRSLGPELHWTGYQTYEQILEWFDYLVELYPDIVTIIHGGETFEGRNITGIKISRRPGRRAFFVEGGQVGADWLSPPVVTYLADQLVRGEDPEARAASEDFEWHIFPVINPDGYYYSQNAERLWLKNRRPISGSAVGVDLTKNWNSQWGVSGGSHTAGDNNYIGLGPFSEIETRSLSRYIDSLGTNLDALLSFRQFGQRFLIPFAHSSEPMYNYNDMLIVARRAMGSLSVKYNTQYSVGTSRNVHDGATGVLADWAKHRFNPPVVGTFQLRDLGTWGYIFPVIWIQPSCEETYDAVMAIIREAKFLNLIS